jgi:hypothetical protein
MPTPARSQGKGGSGRQPKKTGKGAGKNEDLRAKRLRATAAALAPELFPEEETAGFAPRPAPEVHGPSAEAETPRGGVSKQALKFVLGILLLPVAFILTGGFLGTLKQSVHDGLLAQRSFGCLAAGMLLFAILFAVVPRRILMLAYVFGHEVTHALWVKLFGGKVANQFHVSLEGGHVLTDRVNTWIVLSPYFFPIYSILAGTLYGVLLLSGGVIDLMNGGGGLYAGIASFQWLFLLVIGCTLAFHLAFTFLLVTKSQPDLHYGGTFFSLTVIYLINLLIITGLLLGTSRHGLWGLYGECLVRSAELFVELCGQLWVWSAEGIAAIRAMIVK